VITLGIDEDDLMLGTADLAAKYKAGLEFLALDGALFLLHSGDVPDVVRGLFEAADVHEVYLGVLLNVGFYSSYGGLCGGQITSTDDYELSFSVYAKAKHFAVG